LKILETLNKARNDSGKVVQDHIKEEAGMNLMITSGARGSSLNLAQMAGCVGQQALRGKRIERGYRNRTLSCFKEEDLSPKARGFIKNSFTKGLEPHEFFFMSMTGRDSLMDTGLRTPKSGYLYRRLANAMQDLKVEYDGTVRDATKNIVQFKYGEDGLDISKSENGKINVQRIIKMVTNK
jgi:DNA-directed RNA polymerase subunit A'